MYGFCSVALSFTDARSQFSVLKFYNLLAVDFPHPHPQLLQSLSLLKWAKEENGDFCYGKKFFIFQKTFPKSCHSLHCCTTLDSAVFSVMKSERGSGDDALRWTLRFLAQAVWLGLNVLVLSHQPGHAVLCSLHLAGWYVINHIGWCMRKKDSQ